MIINNQFVIQELLDQGKFGYVFNCQEIFSCERYVIKIQTHKNMATNEVQVL